MKILISNDDGYLADGIGILAKTLSKQHTVCVVAPHRQRSAASRSMTLFDPLRVERVRLPLAPEVEAYSVTGMPVDCVRLGLGNLFPNADIVLSGINHGGNLGTETLYSGIVAAAHEAALLGFPAIAVSCLASRPKHPETAAEIASRLVDRILSDALPFGTVLNVNVPDLPMDELAGIKTAPLAVVDYALRFEERTDPYGGRYFWAPSGQKISDSKGQDVDERYVLEGYAVCTPLTYDLTDRKTLDRLDVTKLLHK